MFISNTRKDREKMLEAIGVGSFRDLIKQIPEKFLYPEFKLPPEGLDEMQTARALRALASGNKQLKSFVGAGAYERYIPAALKALLSRGEFLTAYTPYQAEASQGILQTIYEYQSSMSALYEMDCCNASMYDGASSFAEAVRAAVRVTGRRKVLVAQSMHPQYTQTLRTYFANGDDLSIVEIPHKNGCIDLQKLETLLDGETACAAVQSPNFFGMAEALDRVSALAKAKGALFVAAADPVSLALFAPPGAQGADFAVGEGQSLGLPLNYGGPYLGIFTCKNEYLRQMPGRIAGMTKDKSGKRGFVLTLQAREQHIRRDKASSNICSNEALCALGATIYLALLGPEGLKELAQTNFDAAHHAAERLCAIKGVSLKFTGTFFNEFTLALPCAADKLRTRLIEKDNIDPGLPLKSFFPDLGETLLVCATETKTEDDISRLERAIREAIAH